MEKSNELDILYQHARSARDSGDDIKALEFYSTISKMDPDSWEAYLYHLYYTMKICPPNEMGKAREILFESLCIVNGMIKRNVAGRDEQIQAVKENAKCCLSVADTFFERAGQTQEAAPGYITAYMAPLILGDSVDEDFADYEELHKVAVDLWKDGIKKNIKMLILIGEDVNGDDELHEYIKKYTSKIQKYDSSYQPPSNPTDELDFLYQLARSARDSGDDHKAFEYYISLAKKDTDGANSWEANLYPVYYTMKICPPNEISSSKTAEHIITSQMVVLNKIKNHVPEKDKQIQAIQEATNCWVSIADMFFERGAHAQEPYACYLHSYFPLLNWGDLVEQDFGNYEKIHKLIVDSWKNGIEKIRKSQTLLNKLIGEDDLHKYVAKIQKYDSVYQPPQPPSIPTKVSNQQVKSGGCYVATAIYGSYDCPQVWTLRRYRDNTLSQTWYGRLFVHIYYAVSPTLVKLFGDTAWFKKLFKVKLDRFVFELQKKGVESTPYNDKKQ